MVDLLLLHKKSSPHGLIRILTAVLVLGVSSYLLTKSLPLFLVFCLIGINGYVMAGFFSVIHYCAHGTFVSQRWLNVFLGKIFSLPILMNFSTYKNFHLQHHRYTGSAGDSEPAGEIRNIFQYLFYTLNWDYIIAFTRLSLASLVGYYPFFVKGQAARRAVQLDALLSVIFIAFLVSITYWFPKDMLLVYFVPIQLALSINFFLVIGEHYGFDPNIEDYTRTFGKQSWLFNFFHHYSNYHAAHHLSPQVPPWNIPGVHLHFKSVLKEKPIGYLRFNFGLLRFLWNKPLKKPSILPPGRQPHFFFELKKVK